MQVNPKLSLSKGQDKLRRLYLKAHGVAVLWERKGGETNVLDPTEIIVQTEDGTNEKLADFVYEGEE